MKSGKGSVSSLYIAETERNLKAVDAIWRKLPEDKRKLLSEYYTSVLQLAEKARQALRAGKEAVSLEQAATAHRYLAGMVDALSRGEKAKVPSSVDAWEALLNEEFRVCEEAYAAAGLAAMKSVEAWGKKWSWQSAQFLSMRDASHRLLVGRMVQYDDAARTIVRVAREGVLDRVGVAGVCRETWTHLARQSHYVGCGPILSDQKLEGILKPLKPGDEKITSAHMALVRQSFITWQAVHAYMGSEFVHTLADRLNVSRSRAHQMLCEYSTEYAGSSTSHEAILEVLLGSSTEALAIQRTVGEATPSKLALVLAALSLADDIATMATVRFELEVLAPEFNDDLEVTGYRQEFALPTALNASRRRAIAAIADAQALKIDCVSSLILMQLGDHLRDAPDGSKLGALECYWRAYMNAKILKAFTSRAPPTLGRQRNSIDNQLTEVTTWQSNTGFSVTARQLARSRITNSSRWSPSG